MRISVVNDGLL